MELARVKKLLATATRGHKLLKDKLDELMKQFLDIVRENKQLREEAEAALDEAYKSFIIARAVMSEEYMGESLMMAESSVDVSVSEKNIMSVIVPRFKFNTAENEKADVCPYGYAFTSAELDGAVEAFSSAMQPLLKLAESEKSAQLLAQEIEKTRRRVSALENVMIPNYEETIKYIKMKLEENERAGTTRMMKVKDMIAERAIEERRLRDKLQFEKEQREQKEMA